MMATPGASRLMAVPAMVWSAPRRTVAVAWRAPNRAPAKPPQRKPIQGLPVKWATTQPEKAPAVIMPSMPMFTTPDTSEKQEPSAANSSGGVNSRVA